MADRFYIGKAQWLSILKGWLDQFTILAPLKEKNGTFMQKVEEASLPSIVYDQVRAAQPLKTWFFPALEDVVSDTSAVPAKPWLFLGVKSCGLEALSILDQAYGGQFADPKYQARRQSSVIISSDCSQPLETCFCTKVGGKPFAEKNFDLNLSKVWDGFVVEIGSERGRKLLAGHEGGLKEVVKEEADALTKMRQETLDRVNALNADFDLAEDLNALVARNWESEVWKKHAETCVECGACNHACPTCHCYFLDDVTRGDLGRLRGWDSCQYSGYAVTAGGGTPRPRLYERFRNRYFCKFKYLPANYGQLGCTGCGRCIAGCQGKIDMRSALSDLT